MLLQAVSFVLTSFWKIRADLQVQSAKPPVPADLPRGERGRGRGNAIRQGWCGPQAQPRTRPCLMGLPEGEGSALTLTARGVWLVQIPLVQEPKAAGPSARPQFRKYPLPAQTSNSRNLSSTTCRGFFTCPRQMIICRQLIYWQGVKPESSVVSNNGFSERD